MDRRYGQSMGRSVPYEPLLCPYRPGTAMFTRFVVKYQSWSPRLCCIQSARLGRCEAVIFVFIIIFIIIITILWVYRSFSDENLYDKTAVLYKPFTVLSVLYYYFFFFPHHYYYINCGYIVVLATRTFTTRLQSCINLLPFCLHCVARGLK